MSFDPATGGKRPPAICASIDLLKIPIIGALLKKILGGFPPDRPEPKPTEEKKS